MYTLYHSRYDKVIEVKKARKTFLDLDFKDHVTRYNDCFYICLKRAPLIEKAKELKASWINDLEEELNAIKCIEI